MTKYKEELDKYKGTEFDPEVKWSFYQLLPEAVTLVLEKIDMDMFSKTEEDLELICSPSPSMNRVRIAFQRNYHKAKTLKHPELDWYKISKNSGVSLRQMDKMFTTKNTLVWILSPVVNIHRSMEEVYYEALRKLRSAMEAPLYLPTGELDSKAANFIFKVFTHLDKRQFGEFKQDIRIEDATTGETKVVHKDIDDIDSEIKQVEQRLKEIGHVEEAELPQEDIKKDSNDTGRAAGDRGIKVKAKKA